MKWKKIIKKRNSIILTMCFLLTFFASVPAKAAETLTTDDGNFNYTVLSDGTVEISKYVGTETVVTIPAKIDGKTVTRIGADAFWHCIGLTAIEIPASVTSIGSYAFGYCSGLTAIEVPASVTSIGDHAFDGCNGLTAIEIPVGVTSIGDYAFCWCSSLTAIEIPVGVTSIGDCAFYDCRSLTGIEVPASVASIGSYAFAYCSSLTAIEIPASVTSIGDNAFENYAEGFVLEVERNSAGHAYAEANNIPYRLYDRALEKAQEAAAASIGQQAEGAKAQIENMPDLTEGQVQAEKAVVDEVAQILKDNVQKLTDAESVESLAQSGALSFNNVVSQAGKIQEQNRAAAKTDAIQKLEELAASQKAVYDALVGLTPEEKAERKAEVDKKVAELKTQIQDAATITAINIIMDIGDNNTTGALEDLTAERDKAARSLETRRAGCADELNQIGGLEQSELADYGAQLNQQSELAKKNIENTGTLKDIWDTCDAGIASMKNVVAMAKGDAANRIPLAACTVKVSGSFTYTGSEIQPKVTVSYGTRVLSADEDYIVSYENNVDAGTAKVLIEGVSGVSYGTAEKTFTIAASAAPRKAIESFWEKNEKKKVSKRTISVTYTGKNITKKQIVNALNTHFKKVLKESITEGTDYTLSFKKIKKLGAKTTVTMKFKGNYTGSTKFVIWIHRPMAPTGIKIKQSGKNVVITWKKPKGGATGYYIYRTTKKRTSGNDLKEKEWIGTVRKGSALKYTDTKAKKGKRYYYYVIAFYQSGEEDSGVSVAKWKKNYKDFKVK